jgi:hypothetical protein
VCGGLANIYRIFTFGNTATLVSYTGGYRYRYRYRIQIQTQICDAASSVH